MIVKFFRAAIYTCIFTFALVGYLPPASSQNFTQSQRSDNESAAFKSFLIVAGDQSTPTLKWNTKFASSLNYIEIERSVGSEDFRTIAIFFGPENNQQAEEGYEYADNSLAKTRESVVRYRLKMSKYDGGYFYSDIKIFKNNRIAAEKVGRIVSLIRLKAKKNFPKSTDDLSISNKKNVVAA